jgi:hypothetical protein
MGEPFDPQAAKVLATNLSRLLRVAGDAVVGDGNSAQLVAKVTGHLGVDLSQIVVVSQLLDLWEHVSLQRGVEAYLAEREGDNEWFGIAGMHRGHEDTMSMLMTAQRHGMYELGAVDLTTAAAGPDETCDVVRFGMVLTTAPDGSPIIVTIRNAPPMPMRGEASAQVEVLAPDREHATATRDRIDELIRANDVLRGQVMAFGASEHRGNDLVSFLPRPSLTREQVILPDGVLTAIEDHVVDIGKHGSRLRSVGQHLKRGLLLHGAPGTGKTHTVRYLMSLVPETTVIVLTGPAMKHIGLASALARRLQPAMIVVEDVDLVAQDRSMTDHGQPLLFTLLEEMDGIAGDTDVTFVLTTNRASVLERALADRPGRVDLAVEIPRPDREGRTNLLQLYGRDVQLADDLDEIVSATEGVTASFIKELIRRAVLRVIETDPITVDTAALLVEYEAMQEAHNAVTRSLLGG